MELTTVAFCLNHQEIEWVEDKSSSTQESSSAEVGLTLSFDYRPLQKSVMKPKDVPWACMYATLSLQSKVYEKYGNRKKSRVRPKAIPTQVYFWWEAMMELSSLWEWSLSTCCLPWLPEKSSQDSTVFSQDLSAFESSTQHWHGIKNTHALSVLQKTGFPFPRSSVFVLVDIPCLQGTTSRIVTKPSPSWDLSSV